MSEIETLEQLEDIQRKYWISQYGHDFQLILDARWEYIFSKEKKKKDEVKMERIISEVGKRDLVRPINRKEILKKVEDSIRDRKEEAIDIDSCFFDFDPIASINRGEYSKFEDPCIIHSMHVAQHYAKCGLSFFFKNNFGENSEYEERFNRNIKFGTLPVSSFNASAITLPNSDWSLVLVNSGLPKLINRLSRILMAAFFSLKLEDIPEVFEMPNWELVIKEQIDESLEKSENKYIVESLLAAISDYLNTDCKYIFDIENFYGEIMIPAGMLTTACEIFVLGHEYGHIINGDNRDDLKPFVSLRPEFDYLSQAHRSEFLADYWGTISLIGASNILFPELENPASTGFEQGANLFFWCVTIINSFQKIGVDDSSESHPPTMFRAKMVEEHIFTARDSLHKLYTRQYDIIMEAILAKSLDLNGA